MVTKYPLHHKTVLITCGPTWVAVDDMRVISNRSTGRLGHLLAERFLKEKSSVTLIEGPVEERLNNKNIKVIRYNFFNELEVLLKKELTKRFEIVIHAAAVSDYKPDKPFKKKISSGLNELSLKLVPTRKIITMIKRVSPKSFLVGFKLESKMTPTIARQVSIKLFSMAKCDLVVANSLTGNKYNAFIIDKIGNILAKADSKENITENLVKIIRKLK